MKPFLLFNNNIFARRNNSPYSLIRRPMQTHKKYLPWDQEGYDTFEYTDEKLSTRRIQWCEAQFYIFCFWRVILENLDKKIPNFFVCPAQLDAPRRKL